MPTASIINYRAREIRANATIVKVGIGGAIDLLAQNGAPLIVDVTGWFIGVGQPPPRGASCRSRRRGRSTRVSRRARGRWPPARRSTCRSRRRCRPTPIAVAAHGHADRVAGLRFLHRVPRRHHTAAGVDDQRRRACSDPSRRCDRRRQSHRSRRVLATPAGTSSSMSRAGSRGPAKRSTTTACSSPSRRRDACSTRAAAIRSGRADGWRSPTSVPMPPRWRSTSRS